MLPKMSELINCVGKNRLCTVEQFECPNRPSAEISLIVTPQHFRVKA